MCIYVIGSDGQIKEKMGDAVIAVSNWESRAHPLRKERGEGWATHHLGICLTALSKSTSPRTCGRPKPGLEVVFQAELHGAGAMRIHGMQEGTALEATGVTGRIVRATVAGNGVAACVALVGIVYAELGVVENVEGFGAKLEIAALGDFEVLQ